MKMLALAWPPDAAGYAALAGAHVLTAGGLGDLSDLDWKGFTVALGVVAAGVGWVLRLVFEFLTKRDEIAARRAGIPDIAAMSSAVSARVAEVAAVDHDRQVWRAIESDVTTILNEVQAIRMGLEEEGT